MSEYEIKVECSLCHGSGQEPIRGWKGHVHTYRLSDCPACDGHGEVTVIITDERKNSKQERPRLPVSAPDGA